MRRRLADGSPRHVAAERSRLAARDSPAARASAREGLDREVDVLGLIGQASPPSLFRFFFYSSTD